MPANDGSNRPPDGRHGQDARDFSPQPNGSGDHPSAGSSESSSVIDQGCIAIFAVLMVLALLWLALLYLGIPVGIIGGCVAIYLFKANSASSDDFRTSFKQLEAEKIRQNAVILGAISAVLVIASLLGNYFHEDAPLYPYLNGAIQPALDQDGDR